LVDQNDRNANGLAVPNPLFKYRKVDCYTERFVVHREIYFASPADFNDPFDTRAYLTVAPEDAVRASAVQEFARRSSNEEARRFEEVLGAPEQCERFERDAQDPLVAKIHERMGIYCLAEVFDDILMWSHYANQHSFSFR
jgi:hypothetical protein